MKKAASRHDRSSITRGAATDARPGRFLLSPAHAGAPKAIYALGLLPLLLAPGAALAAGAAGAAASGGLTLSFEPVLTHALTGALAAATAWLWTRNRAEKAATEKSSALRVAVERQPPLGEDVARNYATKEEVRELREDLSRMRETEEARARALHSRIDDIFKILQSMQQQEAKKC